MPQKNRYIKKGFIVIFILLFVCLYVGIYICKYIYTISVGSFCFCLCNWSILWDILCLPGGWQLGWDVTCFLLCVYF